MDETDKTEIFEELNKLQPNLANPVSDPDRFILDLHRSWKEAGGLLSGKPRHSDRYLDDTLRAAGINMRSLTPKLLGRTRIKADDAQKLVRFFLTNWPQIYSDATSEAKTIRYQPLLSKGEIEEIGAYLALHVEQFHRASAPEFIASPAVQTIVSSLPGRDLSELIPELFVESDAFFIVATERATVSQADRAVLLSFRDLMNDLYSIDEETERVRPLIWVIDLGRRTFENLGDRLKYIGFSRLQMRFKALREFKDVGRESRWNWLLSRAAFVVLDALHEENVGMRGVKRPDFFSHHVSLTAIAPEWASSPNFRTLYGKELEDIDQRSFSVFFNVHGWPYDGEMVTEEVQHCRYFGYAAFGRDQKPTAEKLPRGLELPFMNPSYEEAYKTIYIAATELLNLENRLANSEKHAAVQLRSLGFRLLSLEEFMKL